ncbi:type II toxin-antitoxin system RelE/ParE family toxin [Hyphomicrobium sp.]|uniref:type II toxin-antitoxin system RelE/ParE family toxin n=1 Tax=Hyphomicrobium sp. TaxID=82 RepID=UPI003F701103
MVREVDPTPRKIPLRFFRTGTGAEPVKDWIKGLDAADRKAVGVDLMQVQFGWPVGMPLCRSLGRGLWEVRTDLSDDRISRVIFCFSDGELIALNGFIKKTQKTPPAEIETALKRKKEYER